ncbi:pyridoxal kinase [Helicocarpus griseus UAMH5409]|uniref:pyridoxal kinase n=1 Tax=Helicocarpus griseus UAMH5409 TaxID=1447875 RepID=A0A2B7Y4W0_9EURO|nr:pyridoxal kinase [Helicocarpus griseus UAMH5409]
MATFVMQSLGCDVAAINTVHFSNHTGYRQVKGTKSTAQEISALYAGLKQSYLTDFDVLLSGYAPSAAAVEAVGEIALDLRRKSNAKPGSFFWVLDPVMGDQGRIYVNEDVVPAYKKIIPHADLILPNQFEAELLSGIKITSLSNLADAITALHRTYNVPHIIVTSVQLPSTTSSASSTVTAATAATDSSSASSSSRPDTLTIIGSTARSDGSPRLFKVEVPRLDCFFSGTGDMFAALTVARLREAVFAADTATDNPSSSSSSTPLRTTPSWQSPDHVRAHDLPLARSTVKVLASMHRVLEKTMVDRSAELARYPPVSEEDDKEFAGLSGAERRAAVEKRAYLRATKAAEIRLVRNVGLLQRPEEGDGVEFVAEEWGV